MSQVWKPAQWLTQKLRLVCMSFGCVALAVLLMGFGAIPLQLKDLHVTPCPDTPEYTNLVTSNGNPIPARCPVRRRHSGQPLQKYCAECGCLRSPLRCQRQ